MPRNEDRIPFENPKIYGIKYSGFVEKKLKGRC